MFQISHRYTKLSTACLGALLLASASTCFAQSGGSNIIKPFRTFKANRAVVDNTNRFWPRINHVVSQKEIRPENPKLKTPLRTGNTNNLQPGNEMIRGAIAPGVGFDGIGATGWMPPDCHMAVGTNEIVEVVNSSVAFFNKATGQKTFEQDFGTFFTGLGAGTFLYDPKVIYDHYAKRFMVLCLEEDDTSKTSKVLIGVSAGDSTAGTWFKYRIEAKMTVDSKDYWLDYPGFGYNKDAIVVTGNMFPFADGGVFVQGIVIKKALLLTGGAPEVSSLVLPGTFTVQPAHMHGNENRIYAASQKDNSSLYVWAFMNLTTTPTVQSVSVDIPSFSTPAARYAPSIGGGLDTLGDRFMDSYYRDGMLLTTHTTASPTTGLPQASCWEIDTKAWPSSGNNPVLNQNFNASRPDPESLLMTAAARNKDGDISMIFTRCSPAIAADIMVSTRTSNEALGTTGIPELIVSSTGIAAGDNRWGDYFACEVDPVDDITFWGVGELLKGSSQGDWGTYIASWLAIPETVDEDVALGAISMYQGSATTGALSDALTLDANYFNVVSVRDRLYGSVASHRTGFTVTRPVAQIEKLAFKFTEQVTTAASVPEILFLYDFNTRKFVSVGGGRVALGVDGEDVITIPKSSVSRFIGPGGEVRAVTQSNVAFQRGKPAPPTYQLKTNLVKLVVTYRPPRG